MFVVDIKEFYKQIPINIVNDPIQIKCLYEYYLAAPRSFWTFLNQDMSKVVNGCGPGGIGNFLVPDIIYGLDITLACKIHDWMYTIYNDEAGFKIANQIFLDNMIRINNKDTKYTWLKWLRTRRILKYYKAVRDFGRLFFYDAHLDLYDNQNVYN